MSKDDIRRYTLDEVRSFRERAPEMDVPARPVTKADLDAIEDAEELGDEFWDYTVRIDHSREPVAEVRLDAASFGLLEELGGGDARAAMEHVLEAFARAQMRKKRAERALPDIERDGIDHPDAAE